MTKNELDARNHDLWDEFRNWAIPRGVDTFNYEDWGDWWSCFKAGAEAEENSK